VASAKVRSLIAKLLRLAQSPEPEEAARAREQAERLMVKHGLTEADFEEDVIEIADETRDELRQRIAMAVGVSRRCSPLISKRGQIGFRGRPAAAASARDMYKALVREVSTACESGVGPHDPGYTSWKLWFWTGFTDAVVRRLIDDEARAWQPPKREAPKPSAVEMAPPSEVLEEPEPVIPVQYEIQRAVEDFAAHFAPEHRERGVKFHCQTAYSCGQSCGERVPLPARDNTTHRAALGRGGEGNA
jgi:hypothetical protein